MQGWQLGLELAGLVEHEGVARRDLGRRSPWGRFRLAVERFDGLPESPALSILANPPGTFEGRKLGILVSDGADAKILEALRAAAERAVELGRAACQAAGVQLLDQTVHARGLRVRRTPDGWIGLERTFRFEYSHDGEDRLVGRLVLHGDRLVGFSGPVQAIH